MKPRAAIQKRSRERGQTLAFVAIFLLVLIGIAAIAIDVTTLYVTRGEAQRAADAAALAGAKALVDSGVTTSPGDPNLQTLAQSMATAYISATLAQNTVQGVPLTPVGTPTPVYPATNPGNPYITVTLRRANLPLFFARVFGQTLAIVTATATAEAYNPSNPGAAPNDSMPPVAPRCVKPWIIPNADPRHGKVPFIAPDGHIVNPGVWGGSPDGIIGEGITLTNDCNRFSPNCALLSNPPKAGRDPGHLADGLDYVPAQTAPATGPCPACAAGGTPYEQCASCCDGSTTRYSCGVSAPGVLVDTSTNTVSNTITAVDCLIGALGPGGGRGQDSVDPSDFLGSQGADPIEMQGGSSSAHNGSLVSSSRSVVTLPIYDSSATPIPVSGPNLLGPVKIIGYMQAFVQQANSPDADVVITVLNISGCGSNVNTGSPAVSGGGTSPIPVRLIHP